MGYDLTVAPSEAQDGPTLDGVKETFSHATRCAAGIIMQAHRQEEPRNREPVAICGNLFARSQEVGLLQLSAWCEVAAAVPKGIVCARTVSRTTRATQSSQPPSDQTLVHDLTTSHRVRRDVIRGAACNCTPVAILSHDTTVGTGRGHCSRISNSIRQQAIVGEGDCLKSRTG